MPEMLTKYDAEFGLPFQAHVLAVAARTPSFVMRYRNVLDASYFNDPTHAEVMNVLLHHVDTYRAIPTRVTLEDLLASEVSEKNIEKAKKLVTTIYKSDISDAEAVMDRVVEFGKTQAMCLAVLESASEMEKGRRDKVRGLIDRAALVGEDLLSRGINYRETMVSRLSTDDTVETLDMVTTGLVHLDMLLGGGLGRGELGMFLGSPKRGKSTVLVNVAFGALMSAVGYNVVYYSLEINERRIARRFDSRLAGPHTGLRKSDPEKYQKILAERVEKSVKGQLVIKSYPTRSATPSTLRSHLSLLKATGFTPDVVVVDYADIMRAERRLGETRHEQAGIYEDLRAIAGEYNCAMWTASQANRGSISKSTPDMDSVAESFEKIAICDAVFSIGQTQKERLDNNIRLVAIALRNAEDQVTVLCDINRRKQMIRSVGLYDADNNRIDDEQTEDQQDAADKVKATEKKSQVKDLKDKLKAEVAPPVSDGPKKKRKLNGPTKVVA